MGRTLTRTWTRAELRSWVPDMETSKDLEERRYEVSFTFDGTRYKFPLFALPGMFPGRVERLLHEMIDRDREVKVTINQVDMPVEVTVKGKLLQKDIEFTVKGKGRFRFVRATRSRTGRITIDGIGGSYGRERARVFRPEEITTVHRTTTKPTHH